MDIEISFDTTLSSETITGITTIILFKLKPVKIEWIGIRALKVYGCLFMRPQVLLDLIRKDHMWLDSTYLSSITLTEEEKKNLEVEELGKNIGC